MHLKSKGKKQRPTLKPAQLPAVPQRLNDRQDAGTCRSRLPSLPLPVESNSLRPSGVSENLPGAGSTGAELGSAKAGRSRPGPAPRMRGAGWRHGARWRPGRGRPERGARPRAGTPGSGAGDAPGRLPGRGSRGVGPG